LGKLGTLYRLGTFGGAIPYMDSKYNVPASTT
jgi:hypothetical protein